MKKLLTTICTTSILCFLSLFCSCAEQENEKQLEDVPKLEQREREEALLPREKDPATCYFPRPKELVQEFKKLRLDKVTEMREIQHKLESVFSAEERKKFFQEKFKGVEDPNVMVSIRSYWFQRIPPKYKREFIEISQEAIKAAMEE